MARVLILAQLGDLLPMRKEKQTRMLQAQAQALRNITSGSLQLMVLHSQVVNHNVHPFLLLQVPQLDDVAPCFADGGLAGLRVSGGSEAALYQLREAACNACKATQQPTVAQPTLLDIGGGDAICGERGGQQYHSDCHARF